MSEFHDYRWHGDPAVLDAAMADIIAESVIGPVVLDGIAYVAVRALAPIERPTGLSDTGRQLSLAVLGTWADGE